MRKLPIYRCQKDKTVYRGGDGMNKFYDLLKYIIYASFYVIVIKTGMDFYEYKRLNYTNRILHRGIRKRYCIASLLLR